MIILLFLLILLYASDYDVILDAIIFIFLLIDHLALFEHKFSKLCVIEMIHFENIELFSIDTQPLPKPSFLLYGTSEIRR